MIFQLKNEVERLLNTLKKVDKECSNLKFLLHSCHSETNKSKLIAKEQSNLNNTLKGAKSFQTVCCTNSDRFIVQKEARERELQAAKELIQKFKNQIYK